MTDRIVGIWTRKVKRDQDGAQCWKAQRAGAHISWWEDQKFVLGLVRFVTSTRYFSEDIMNAIALFLLLF